MLFYSSYDAAEVVFLTMQYLSKTPFKYVMVQMFDVLFLCCGMTCSEDQRGGIGDT